MLLDTLLDPRNLNSVFQPIVRLCDDGPRLHALECLTRGTAGSHFESAEVMFEYIRCMAAEPRMDLLCIQSALRCAAALPGTPTLTFNVHTATLSRMSAFPHELERLLAEANVSPGRIVIEVTEHAVAWRNRTFHDALDYLRGLGMAIALDDVGTEAANLKMIVDVRPDILKIDRYLVHRASTDAWRQAAVESIVTLGRRFGVDVVAEGISTEADLETARALGVDLAQGFFLAKPAPAAELLVHPLLASSARGSPLGAP
jgi:EAL domain-containing protein (putative c-di-GMP-specific phosphodiesterase class I)